MELKSYQARTIAELKEYIEFTKTCASLSEAYEAYWNVHNIIPAKDSYIKPYNDSVKNAPHVCLKVPTAGGKTFIACNAIKAIFDGYSSIQSKAVVWLVPSDAILEQTVATLKDSTHPYRQRINVDFANRVEVYEKSELLQARGFSSTSTKEVLSIFVLSFDSIRTTKKEGRKVYQDNGNLMSFADEFEIDINAGEEITLMKVISSLHPVIIVDESHNATTPLSLEMLGSFEPSFVLDLTATPKENSNIISFVTAQELKNENMVKLPVIIQNNSSVESVIGNALHLQRVLELKAKQSQKTFGTPYIRPIVLFQAQPKTGEEATTFEKIKQLLIKVGCKKEEIAIKTADINELKNVKLTSERCKIRYIITVNALKEGWDCPFAYILASVANRTADVDVTQILGRILRQPYVMHYPDENLNSSYVLTNSADFFKTVERIAYTLNQNHFTRKDFRAYDEKSVILSGHEKSTDVSLASLPQPDTSIATQHEATSTVQKDFNFEEPPLSNENTQGSEDLNKADATLIAWESANYESTYETNAATNNTSLPEETKTILKMAEEAQKQTQQENENAEHKNPVAPELKEQLKNNQYAIKEEFKEDALSLKIPQFSLPVYIPATLGFEGIDEDNNTMFNEAALLTGFELSKKDISINFTAEPELYEIDSTKSEIQQMTFKKISGTELENLKSILFDKNQKKTAKIELATDKVMNLIGSKYPIDDRELKKYIERILESFSDAEFEKFVSNILLYSKAISEKIDELSAEYAEPKFYNMLEAEKIQTKCFYKLPKVQTLIKPCDSPIPKSLYEKEGDINGFEKDVINEVANLPNVEWWHRNPSKIGFCINGFINHYPDFIVKTTNGKIVMIETKGDHLIATKKIKLGNTWAQYAGNQFKYFLVYDKLDVDGAKTKEQFLEIMKEL